MSDVKAVFPRSLVEAAELVRMVGPDPEAVPMMAPKAVQACLYVSGAPCYAANIIKQEMLGLGGDAAVHRGAVNCSADRSDVLIMGSLRQARRLADKLAPQAGYLGGLALRLRVAMGDSGGGHGGALRCRGHSFAIGARTYVMGILNVTGDSFSGDGLLAGSRSLGAAGGGLPELASRVAERMVADGADMIDVGGESSRPGYAPVGGGEELERVAGVIRRLSGELGVPISVDTAKPCVAEGSLKAGASMVNYVGGSGSLAEVACMAGREGAGLVIMQREAIGSGAGSAMALATALGEGAKAVMGAGMPADGIVLDPGIGFGKTDGESLGALRRLGELKALGFPVLIGTSRKSFIGNALGLPPDDRLEGTAATVACGVAFGADFIRVHDVAPMVRVARMADALVREGG